MKVGEYSKGIVAMAGVATTAIATYFPTAKWEPLALGFISAVVLILVPNAGKSDG